MSEELQTIIVGVIVVAACVMLWVRMRRSRRKTGCSGCASASDCALKDLKQKCEENKRSQH